MMKRALTFGFACFSLLSCATNEPEDKPKPEPPKLVGRIASIPPDRRFVLIQRYGQWTSEPGSILTTRGADQRSANLLVTGEALGEFAAADLQSGQVELGDAVYSQHIPKPPPASEPPNEASAPETSPAEDIKNPQKTSD
ncbi:MAG: hypothetical protein ACO3F7_01615 [Luteolibacter sp.]